MQLFTVILASMAALAAAVPASPVLDSRAWRGLSCNPSGLSPPAASPPLPSATAGSVVLVAIGKGTQNYSCTSNSSSETPTPLGALATLYNASCVAVVSQNYLNQLTQWGYEIPSTVTQGLPSVGHHYFVDSTTPTFNLNNVGITECKKGGSSAAPANTQGDVPWLYLNSSPTGTTDKITNVYRVETNGGAAPSSCAGQTPGTFTVPYTAQYWFYST